MLESHDAKWLQSVSRHLRRLAIPKLAAALTTVQICGFFAVSTNPAWLGYLVLEPNRVWLGEIWRVLSFLAIPATMNLIGFIFTTGFGYFIISSIESEWGQAKTMLYALVSVLLTIIFSLAFGYPIDSISGLASTFFLAAAALFPDEEIRIYFFFPVKMKYLGWLALVFVLFHFVTGTWLDRLFLIAVYANYLIFFGPTLMYRLKQWKRRRDFKSNWR
jgi:hypothetical protein